MAKLEYNRDIGSLPNEILINILSLLSTRQLLPLTTISHHIHNVILRIIHYRLLASPKFAGHQVILECYLPSAKMTTPYFVCDLVGTDHVPDEDLRLGKLRNMYSHFRPIPPEGDRKIWKSMPPAIDQSIQGKEEYVSQDIDLESYEFFAQLQSVVSMVKVGPRAGYFSSNVTIDEGLTRVWRNWLLDRVEADAMSGEEEKKKLLWSSVHEHTGLRLNVEEINKGHGPVLRSRNDDENVGYQLQYEELVIRTSQILLAIEQSMEQEARHEGAFCGLDGVFLQESYRGRRVEESTQVYWRPVVDAYGGRPHGVLPTLIGW